MNTHLQRLERLVAGLPAEASALWDDLQAVKRQLRQLESAADAHGRQHADLDQRLSLAQRRNAELARQLVAVRQLHSTLDRGALLLAVEEILGGLIGCEEWALFEGTGASELSPAQAFGIAADELSDDTLTVEPIATAAASGALWVAEDRGAGDRSAPRLTACVPLLASSRVVGVLALFRLLEHRPALESGDLELLELLSVHVGTALLATRGQGRR
jgi:GAF domain-containing protein